MYGQTSTGGECVTFFPADAEVLNYCKNGAKCGVNLVSGDVPSPEHFVRVENRGPEAPRRVYRTLLAGVMLQLVCDCESLQTTEVFYGGPDCSVKGKMNYLTGSRERLGKLLPPRSAAGLWREVAVCSFACLCVSVGSDVPNTCWLENILGLNAWKDVAARVSSFCYEVPCPSPDGSSS